MNVAPYDALFDQVVLWAVNALGEAAVRAARTQFEAATGPIEEGSPDYEARIAHFFEAWLCQTDEHDAQSSLLTRFVEATQPEPLVHKQLAALQYSHRTLFEFTAFEHGVGCVRDLLRHGQYRFQPTIHDRVLRSGDRFDGRILAGPDGLMLSRGRVYHPRAAHLALDKLLAEPSVRSFALAELLDGLLRMRSRFLRFESIRPEHVFSFDGLSESAFAAPWARPEQRQRYHD